MKNKAVKITSLVLALTLAAGSLPVYAEESIEFTNVSYDPTRELYAAYNEIFTKHYEETTGQKVEVVQSHGGSGKQALEVANGLEAEVRALCERGLRETPTASQAIGYKEFYPYFDGLCPLEAVKEAICRNTRRYAKRQETWFSHMDVQETVVVP